MRREEETGFMEAVLNERINVLLKRKVCEKELEALDRFDAVIADLPEAQRESVRAWLELSADREAEDQRTAYLGGLSDGLWLARKVYLAEWT